MATNATKIKCFITVSLRRATKPFWGTLTTRPEMANRILQAQPPGVKLPARNGSTIGAEAWETVRKRDFGVIPAVVANFNAVKKKGECEPQITAVPYRSLYIHPVR